MRAPDDVAVSQAARCVKQHSDDRFRRLRWISPPPCISIENDKEDGMSSQVHQPTGTRGEWFAARDQLLVREKEHELARLRRELPWVPVEKEYRFDTDEGEKTLSELFDRRSQLLVYHFMFYRSPLC